MVRSAMNEGKSRPINVRITAKNMKKARKVAEGILEGVKEIDGVVDARIIQRLDYPQYVMEVDQAKAAALGLNQADVMQNVVSAFNSSVQFNKKNFWIDPKSTTSISSACNTPRRTSPPWTRSSTSRSPARHRKADPASEHRKVPLPRVEVPAEINHTNLQATMDLTMGVQGGTWDTWPRKSAG